MSILSLYSPFRPLLFAMDPELSHDITLKLLKGLSQWRMLKKPSVPAKAAISCFGLNFPNPVGLAAGLDKNGECLKAWEAIGFGFIEIGTVTPKAQAGNPKPRLFRLKEHQAIINRMGFNNKGVDYLIEQVASTLLSCPLGINIGKNRDTALENAHEDYLHCFQKVYPYADYVTVNLSSPNTPGLKSLQHGESLKSILTPLKIEQAKLTQQYQKQVPILVKISPDLSFEELKEILDHLVNLKIDGVIATNTTVNHEKVQNHPLGHEAGGLSGAPLFNAASQMIQNIYQQVGDSLPIIAVGGIMTVEQAKEKFKLGAKLIQLYTGLIYRGPNLVQEILQQLSTLRI